MKISKELRDQLVCLTESMIGEDGLEYCNPNPMVVDVGPKRLSLEEQIERILRREISRVAYKEGLETFEEANDFEVPDEDPLPMSGFEFEEMKEEVVPAPKVEPEATPEEQVKFAEAYTDASGVET